MKRWLVRTVVILLVLLGAVAQDAPILVAERASASAQKQDPKTVTVYLEALVNSRFADVEVAGGVGLGMTIIEVLPEIGVDDFRVGHGGFP